MDDVVKRDGNLDPCSQSCGDQAGVNSFGYGKSGGKQNLGSPTIMHFQFSCAKHWNPNTSHFMRYII